MVQICHSVSVLAAVGSLENVFIFSSLDFEAAGTEFDIWSAKTAQVSINKLRRRDRSDSQTYRWTVRGRDRQTDRQIQIIKRQIAYEYYAHWKYKHHIDFMETY